MSEFCDVRKQMRRGLRNDCKMNIDVLIALSGFAFVTSVTPGPNNMMLLASGANFGLRRSLPHMLGITLGHGLMVFLVGLGLGVAIKGVPGLVLGLKLLALAYMLWLAWKIAHAAAPEGAATSARPFTFLQAAAFQWINPKAWAMALGAISAYAPEIGLDGEGAAALAVALVFAAVILPSVAVWTKAGEALRGILREPIWLRRFNWTMATLLVLSLIPVLRVEL
jgi:threonine/homoserine/homoserine lactone efflux protein